MAFWYCYNVLWNGYTTRVIATARIWSLLQLTILTAGMVHSHESKQVSQLLATCVMTGPILILLHSSTFFAIGTTFQPSVENHQWNECSTFKVSLSRNACPEYIL